MGPILSNDKLAEFLPTHPIVNTGGRNGTSAVAGAPFGSGHVLTISHAYVMMMGSDGLTQATKYAILNANYIRSKISDTYNVPFNRPCMHEFVASGESLKPFGVKTLDIAKRLLDYGFHAPTIYFPLIVKEALMIEPTESESKETLEKFSETLLKIAEEAESNPDLLHDAPHSTPVRRLNELKANKELDVCWRDR